MSKGLGPELLKAAKLHLLVEEGLRLKPYKCTREKTTIGIGRNLDDKGITKVEAMFMLHNDIVEVLADLQDIFGEVFNTWTISRQVALISMRFQLGNHGFRKFKKMITALQHNDFTKAADEALDSLWAKVDTPQRAHRVAELMHK